MRQWRFIIVVGAVLVMLGIMLVVGILSSQKIMLALLKDEARSFLSVVALTQENSIFAEGEFEDEIIDRLIDGAHYLESVGLAAGPVDLFLQHFGVLSLLVVTPDDHRVIIHRGDVQRDATPDLPAVDNLYYEYFRLRNENCLRIVFRSNQYLYQFEYPAREIEVFRRDYGINRLLSQLSANPMIRYLALQDQKGIIFATPNITTISRIDRDSLLQSALQDSKEMSRVIMFENRRILELARPFTIAGSLVGLLRIGISLESYQQHLRQTRNQLIFLFAIMFLVISLMLLYVRIVQGYLDREELFARTLSAIGEGVIQVNQKGVITGVNQTFCQIAGFAERQIMRHAYEAIFPGDPFALSRVLKMNVRFEDERLLAGRSIHFAAYPLLDSRQRLSGAIAIVRDMTELRKYEKEREEIERLSFLGNLVANFAHEIKNPLNGLSLATQRLIREHPSSDPEYNELTDGIKKGIDSLNKILNDFLSLARPRLKQKLEFDLVRAVRETVSACRERIRDVGIVIKEDVPESIRLAGNPDDLKRAVLNILLNAIDAVSVATTADKFIGISVMEEPSGIVLSIKDNGLGMDEEEKNMIFTPYFTTKKGGTGLGLFIARQIFKDHMAEIEVVSQKGSGTEFRIRFPVEPSSHLDFSPGSNTIGH